MYKIIMLIVLQFFSSCTFLLEIDIPVVALPLSTQNGRAEEDTADEAQTAEGAGSD